MRAGGSGTTVLGIDLGTTGVKALVLDTATGRVQAAATVEHATVQTPDGGHEQDPAGWWDAVGRACRQVMASAGTRPAAVGLSGQMHSLLLIGADGTPVRPAMTWADRRVGAAARRLASHGAFRERTGNAPVEAFTAPKLGWLAEHDPDALARARHLLLAKDWIGYRLTGRIATDSTDAMGTLLWDPVARRWDDELFALCGAPATLGVPVLASTEVRGTVGPDAAAWTGIPAGTPVVAGAGDVSAAAVGGGAALGRGLCLNVGTAAQVMGVTTALEPGPGFVFGSALGDGFVCMASVYAAGASLRWFERTELDGAPIGEAEAAAPAGARGLSYLPFMFGMTVPRKNDAARGGFAGATGAHTPADRAAAVVEGVAYACADAVEAVARVVAGVATPPRRLVVVGGVTASGRFRAALAAALDLEIVRMPDGGSPLGACLLAAVGTGLLADPDDALRRLPTQPVRPGPDAPAYRAARARFTRRVAELA